MYFTVFCALALSMAVSLAPRESDARAGGSRSIGSRGSRSYSQPAAPPSQSRPYQQAAPQQAPRPISPPPYQAPQPAGGGFFRNMAGGVLGGIAGGMLGGMLFRSLGFGGGGGMGGMGAGGGGGIGFFEILLIGGILYLIYRFIKNKRESTESTQNVYGGNTYQEPVTYQPVDQPSISSSADDMATGISHIRQFDRSFDEQRFCDQVMDIFFKVQSAWMNRDLSLATALLTTELRRTFQDDIDRLIRDKRVNRLENTAVRKVEIVEAWQESGQDYLTTLIYANLLDYTTDEVSGQVVEGSRTEPVKFEEYWTFTRPVGNNQWQLSAINQK
jgi:predicted lipid-binding transport protein (Tim44 family)